MRLVRRIIAYYIAVSLAPCLMAQACNSNEGCPEGSYCKKAPGDCSGVGVCTSKPGSCIEIWDPVCGCDGNTYGNECYAAAAGVNVAYQGPCQSNSCGSNADCPSGTHYCAKEMGDCDGAGVCKERPAFCPDIWDPVCGCDGVTYDNACEAAVAGVNVAYMGPCISAGCMDNGACPPTSYCAKEAGDCNGEGVCTERPTACPDIWDPVCGCDDVTYDNACEAAKAGVSVKYAGPCGTCVNRPLADISGDCWVDIVDLSMLAAQWLDCGFDNSNACFVD